MTYTITEKCIGCSVCKRVCPVEAISGEPKKLHRVADQVCIDCGACGRVCPQVCILDADKKVCERIRIRSHWPKPLFNLSACMACTICVEACPVNAIALEATRGTRETIRYPHLAVKRGCIACEFCMRECPTDAIQMSQIQ